MRAGAWRGGRSGGGRDSVAVLPSGAPAMGASDATGAEAPQLKPGAVYVLRDGKPARIAVMTGLGDGAFFEIESESLKPGDNVLVGLEVAANQNRNLQPPPGMGGPQFRGPGGGGGRGARGGSGR